MGAAGSIASKAAERLASALSDLRRLLVSRASLRACRPPSSLSSMTAGSGASISAVSAVRCHLRVYVISAESLGREQHRVHTLEETASATIACLASLAARSASFVIFFSRFKARAACRSCLVVGAAVEDVIATVSAAMVSVAIFEG